MIIKIIIRTLFLFFLLFSFTAKANDIAAMGNISEAAESRKLTSYQQILVKLQKILLEQLKLLVKLILILVKH